MSTTLARLKEKIARTRLPEEPSKGSKAPFEGFEGNHGRGVSPILPSVSVFTADAVGHEIGEAEREAIAVELGGVPIIYASEFARLQAHPPAEVPRDRWDQFINDAGLFFDRWGKQAEAFGWRADELFGLDPVAPMARYDRMGLIWMLRGEAVLDISETAAKLSGGLTFYRKAIAARERQNKEDCNIQQQYSQ
jgi:hypothetical protein